MTRAEYEATVAEWRAEAWNVTEWTSGDVQNAAIVHLCSAGIAQTLIVGMLGRMVACNGHLSVASEGQEVVRIQITIGRPLGASDERLGGVA